MRKTVLPLIACLAALLTLPSSAGGQNAPIILNVDAREAPRRIFHARLTIPAASGPLTLYYPKWLPGNHRPTGPGVNLTGLKIASGGNVQIDAKRGNSVFVFALP